MSSSTQQINNSFVRASSSPHSSNQSSNNTNNNKSSLIRKNSSLTEVHQHPENENRYCPADHLLLKDAPPAFSCDCCTRSYPAGSESYACRTCFYDCCLRCYCAPTCRGRHILAKGHVGLKFACDLCAKIYAAGSSAHSCREDNFDVCDSCYDQVVQVRLNERMKANVNNNNASTVTVKRGLFASSGGIQNQNMATTAKSSINENNHHAANRPASSPLLSAPKGTKCRSLFIGINYCNSKAELRGSVNDIFTSMKLLRAIGFDLAATKVLTDDRNFIARTGAPDKKSIEASLAWLVDGARNGDHLFFHFAGHATQGQSHHPQQQQKKFSGNDNGVPPSSSSSAPFEDCIVPIDYVKAGLISDEYLFDNLFSKIPQGCRLTAIFDTGVWPASFGSHLDFEWNFEESTSSSSIKRTTSPRTSPNKNGMFMRFAQTQKSATRDENERIKNLAKFSNNNNSNTSNGGEVCVASNAFSRNSNTGNTRTIDFCIPSVGDVLIFSCVRDHLSIPAPEGQDITDYVNQYGGISPAITLDHDFDDNNHNKFNNNAGRSGSVLLNKSVISSGGIALSLTTNLATKIGVDGKPHVSIHEVIFGIQNELEQRGFVDRVLNVSSTKKLDFSGGFSVFGELPTIM